MGGWLGGWVALLVFFLLLPRGGGGGGGGGSGSVLGGDLWSRSLQPLS